ncbi:MAG: ferritin-like domain-containing protein [Planctomycetes bacterium]|nr:ferritin-like domain-containing protein [Planctomycetota bacterium]
MEANRRKARAALVRILQKAHAAERGAAIAYRGHAASVRNIIERDAIVHIERDEWEHRAKLGAMLDELGAGTLPLHEIGMLAIGSALERLCFVSGRRLPMFCAWLLERVNVEQYATAARLARAAGCPHMAPLLMKMEQAEADHVAVFDGFLRGVAPVPAVH